MSTKLSLDCRLLGVTSKEIKFPFESTYVRENPLKVLNFLGQDYNISKYLDVGIDFKSPFKWNGYNGFYGFLIEESDLGRGAIIRGKIKNLDLKFLSKLEENKSFFNRVGIIEELIRKYLIIKYTKYGPIAGGLRFRGDDGMGPRYSSKKQMTENYFKERKSKPDREKEKQLAQILEYARAVLNKPKFSIKNLENVISI